EHAATGVSPKEWCEAQGLNYATARRYIKKTSAQKPAQKKMRTAQKDKSANELVDDDGLTAQQRLFVAEYLKDNNATAAAARAGYSDPNYGRQLITNPNVAQAIAHQQKASIARTLGGADEVLAQMWQLATFDANQLSQYRRGACRYCWGFGHQYQWRDMVEFEEKRLEALERKSREPLDVGGYGYDHTREANPGCQKQLKAANDYYAAEDRLRGDWLTGAKKGWAEFEDSATNVYSQVQTLTSNTFTGMASTLTDFFTTGKANFSDFLTTFLKGTAQMLTQLALVNGMKSAFGGTSFGSFFGFSSGGAVPEFDTGGYTGDGGKYQPKGVVHGGEFVFTKEATSALGVGNLYSLMRSAQGYANGGYVGHAPMYGLQSSSAGGVSIQTSVVVQNQNSQQQTSANNDAVSRAYKQTIDQSVRAGIAKQLQPGGLIWNATKSR
ncbi:phage tail tape measure protein, partial [Enterobacter cloacae complex sp. 413K2]